MHIGYHESSSGGFVAMFDEAVSVGADTFAFFTRNPRGGKAKEIDEADAKKFCQLSKSHNFSKLVAHAPYTMNPCSADVGLRNFAENMMKDDLKRMSYVPENFYNFHPGSHTGQGSDVGIDLTATMLSNVIKMSFSPSRNERTLSGDEMVVKSELLNTMILIETMAGKGSEIGRTFEEVRAIIDKTEAKLENGTENVLGVCLDTCHIWDAGYDIASDLDGVILQFDKIIGLNRLKAIHLNDSMNERGSHKDRHQKLGEGFIGFDALVRVAKHSALKDLPFILETPNDKAGYADEIKRMREAVGE